MKCADVDSLLNLSPPCAEVEGGVRYTTHCLYPSSDPVYIFISKRGSGFRVTDGGGAWRAAQMLGRASEQIFEAACRRHSVKATSGILLAEPQEAEWLYAAALAVANASSMAAMAALEVQERAEKSLTSEIYEVLSRHVPAHRISRNYEYRGRSGHMWPVDFAVIRTRTMLIKTVSQNGNSINSNYATFGDIGDWPDIEKISVFKEELKTDSSALLGQVSTLMPLRGLEFSVLNAL